MLTIDPRTTSIHRAARNGNRFKRKGGREYIVPSRAELARMALSGQG